MSVSDNLRSELMAFQKVQADMSRWKLIMIGAVFTYALGKHPLADPDYSASLSILAVAPPLALFFDVMQYNYDIRGGTIALHLARVNRGYRAYEEWLGRLLENGIKLYQFSDLANLVPSTIICCILLAWVIIPIPGRQSLCDSPTNELVAASATVSLGLLLLARWFFFRRWDAIYAKYEQELQPQLRVANQN